MDPVMIEKLQAMKRYKRRSFFHRIISFFMSLISLGLFLSSPLWLPKLYSFIRFFFLVCIPNAREILLGPKCLFVICNLIVVLLLRDSKGREGVTDIYDEYAKRNKSIVRNTEEKVQKADDEDEEEEEEKEEDGVKSDACSVVEDTSMNEVIEGDEEYENEEDNEFGVDAENRIPTEELNKRIEDFIARFNQERRLEERLLMYRE